MSSPSTADTPHKKSSGSGGSGKDEGGNSDGKTKPTISPQQRLRMATNRAKALVKKLGPLAALPGTWALHLQSELTKPYFSKLLQFVQSEYKTKKVFPPVNEVYDALRCCDASKVKVVIIGQDPYHGPGQAHGLCFSVRKGVRVPPSLKNVYKELTSDLGPKKFTAPTHGYLQQWCDQGVLLLNTVLTVQAHKANSHRKKGWELFTDAIIAYLNANGGQDGKPIVFLCWGKPALAKAKHINRKRHVIISSSHPSPLGATKTAKPFITSKCFSKCNNALVKFGHAPINWTIDP